MTFFLKLLLSKKDCFFKICSKNSKPLCCDPELSTTFQSHSQSHKGKVQKKVVYRHFSPNYIYI